ncbi:MAG: Fe-S cluster domain-containing protein [Flavobacteriaceae bacterium]|nr:Fe-S cluster domain-containing protein [Flavobacteriaceae bacterium]
MTDSILNSVLLLTSLGIFAAVVLYIVSKKFYVYENPLIAEIDELLPAANCAGCGSPGCKAFAEKLVNTEDISALFCPVGGNKVMQLIAEKLGKTVAEKDPTVAVVRCQGSCEVRPKTTIYQGPDSCAISALIYSGETDCQYGCLSEGDCVKVCLFDAMYMDEITGLPVVITQKCTSCGLCVSACPRNIIEMRPRNKKDLKIFVGCLNEDKGGIAKKACALACIGCDKCVEVCPKDAIIMFNNLAYIDPVLCTLCRKCVPVCPTNSIVETNFPVKKEIPTPTLPEGKGVYPQLQKNQLEKNIKAINETVKKLKTDA